jgi:hypothetical protein
MPAVTTVRMDDSHNILDRKTGRETPLSSPATARRRDLFQNVSVLELRSGGRLSRLPEAWQRDARQGVPLTVISVLACGHDQGVALVSGGLYAHLASAGSVYHVVLDAFAVQGHIIDGGASGEGVADGEVPP